MISLTSAARTVAASYTLYGVAPYDPLVSYGAAKGTASSTSLTLDSNAGDLALDVIHERALRGDFLGAEHTVRHVREGWQPELVDRHSYDKWLEGGATSMRERAKAKIGEVLSTESRRILSPDLNKEDQENNRKGCSSSDEVAQTCPYPCPGSLLCGRGRQWIGSCLWLEFS